MVTIPRVGHAPCTALGFPVCPRGSARVVGVTGSMLSGLAYMTIRRLSQSEHPLTILVWFPLATIPFSAAPLIAASRRYVSSTERTSIIPLARTLIPDLSSLQLRPTASPRSFFGGGNWQPQLFGSLLHCSPTGRRNRLQSEVRIDLQLHRVTPYVLSWNDLWTRTPNVNS